MEYELLNQIPEQLKKIAEGVNDPWQFWIPFLSILAAFLVGLGGIFKDQILDLVFRSKIEVRIKGPLDVPSELGGEDVKTRYYNINIKNSGKKVIKNLSAKIKSGPEKEWVHLLRPFSRQTNTMIYIERICVNEDEDFNIGHVNKEDKFIFMTDVTAYNQVHFLEKDGKHVFFLEIVGENLKPQKYLVNIENNGFHNNLTLELKSKD